MNESRLEKVELDIEVFCSQVLDFQRLPNSGVVIRCGWRD